MKTAEKKIKGLWWLPDKPKEKWLGNLIAGKSRSLRLKFTIPEGYCKRLPDAPDVIHGVNSNNKAITLLFLAGQALVNPPHLLNMICGGVCDHWLSFKKCRGFKAE